jgi:hypothetical protein
VHKRIDSGSLSRAKLVDYRQIYRGLSGELVILKDIVERSGIKFSEDILIPRSAGAKALDRLRIVRDPSARDWNILTDIKVDDFFHELVETD